MGSTAQDDQNIMNQNDIEKIREKCNDIVLVIVKKKHSLIVTTDQEDSIENFVVESCVQILNSEVDLASLKDFPRPLLEIRYSLNEAQPFQKKLEKLKNNKDHISIIQDKQAITWNFVGPLSTSRADVVILICGSKNTELIGGTHAINGKLIIPIPYFGGASKNVWNFMKQMSDSRQISLSENEIDKIRNSETKVEEIIQICETNHKKNKQNRLQANKMMLILFNVATLLISITCLLFIFSCLVMITSDQKLKGLNLLVYILITCCGGVFGVTMRSLNNLAKELFSDWSTSFLNLARGLGVGFMVGVLYFAGELTITGNIGNPVDQQTFIRTGFLVSLYSILSGMFLEETFKFFGFSFSRKFVSEGESLKNQ